VTGPPRPILSGRWCSFVIVCFSLLASDGPWRAAHAFTSESPTALLLEARGIAASIDDRAERSAALDPIVVAQIAIVPPAARETLKAFPKLPSKLNYLTALAQAYAATGNVAETERLYAEIVVEDQSSRPGKLAAANALGQVSIAYANIGNLDEAFRTLERLKERTKQESFGIVGIVTAKLAEAQARRGDVTGAVKTALSITGDNPYPLMTIIGDRVRHGKAQEAQGIMASLDDGAQRYAQWGVMQAQIEQGRLIEAQVTASAIKPGHAKASALLELATYHREHGGQRLALTLLQEAEASARSTVNDWTRADILWHIAAETAMAGDAAHAISLATSIEKDGHRGSAILDIAKAQAKRGKFAEAFNTAGLLKQTPPTSVLAISPYNMAISEILVEMVKVGKGTEARDTAARFQDADIRRVWLYSEIAVAYAELGNLKEARAALALAETEAQRSARRKELRQLDDKLRFGHSPADQTRFQELWRVEGDIQRGLEAIARALARKGDLSGAMAVVDELNQPARRLHLIKDVSMLHMEAGREDRTLRWARNLSRPSERVFALVGIATGLSHLTDKRKVKPAPSHKQAPLSP
jgi:tetratricopeptide (TPR) repeat protein